MLFGLTRNYGINQAFPAGNFGTSGLSWRVKSAAGNLLSVETQEGNPDRKVYTTPPKVQFSVGDWLPIMADWAQWKVREIVNGKVTLEYIVSAGPPPPPPPPLSVDPTTPTPTTPGIPTLDAATDFVKKYWAVGVAALLALKFLN